MSTTPDARTRAHSPYPTSVQRAAPAPTGAATHPHDPRPLLDQIDRCYPHGAVVPSEFGIRAINAGHGWAAWYRPLLAPVGGGCEA